MKISVAMTTYNCEKYVVDQLMSIYCQTRPVDEVIICDDGSVDSTKQLVNQFIESHNLSPKWTYLVNEKNKKCTKNFIDCALMTTGDIVLYSDHDDIWDEKKVQIIEQEFAKYEDARLIAHRYISVAEDGKTPIKTDDRYYKDDNSTVKVTFSQAIKSMSIGGAVSAAKRDLIEECAVLSLERGLSHDLPITCVAAAYKGLYMVNTPLMLRRVHEGNGSRPTQGHPFHELRYSVTEKKESRFYLSKFYSEILEFVQQFLTEEEKRNLRKASETMERQAKAIENRKLFSALGDLFRSNPMVDKTRILIDLYCILFGKYIR